MSKTDPSLEPKLSRAPTYQAALRGAWFAPGMPQTPGFKAEHLRAAAKADGIDIPSGYAFKDGRFQDAAEQHWYSDPRVIGPLAVGAATGIGALAGAGSGAAAGAAGAGSTLPGAAVPTAVGMNAVPAAIASQATSAAIPVAATAATTAGTIANTTAAGTSALQKLRAALTSPETAGSLGALLTTLIGRTGGGSGDTAGTEELRRINAITEARMRRSDPLHEVATQLAYQRAPIAAKAGISLPRVPLP